ncbi:MAG TPA: hypothetical protein VLU25_22340 [Acidobacteriota bacterium]|nr:hypothetical protein [Acidobacteriota bacterium]
MSDDDFVQFKLTYDPAQIAVLKSVLEDQEIPYFVQGENFATLYPTTPFLSGFRLRVHKQNEARVRELLDKLVEEIEPLDEEAMDEDEGSA